MCYPPCQTRLRLLHFFGFRHHIFNRPLHVERLLGNIVVVAVANVLEALDGLRQIHFRTSIILLSKSHAYTKG